MAAEAGGVVGAEGVRGALPVVLGTRLPAGCAVGEHWGQGGKLGDTGTKPPFTRAVGVLPSWHQKQRLGRSQLAVVIPKGVTRDAEERRRVWNLLPDFRRI